MLRLDVAMLAIQTCEAALHQQGPPVMLCTLSPLRSLINSRKHLLLLHVCRHPQLKGTLTNPRTKAELMQELINMLW